MIHLHINVCQQLIYPKVQRDNYLSTYLYYTLKKLTFEIIYLSYCRNILKILVFFWWYYIFPFFFISYDIYISTFINSIYSQKFSLETVYKVCPHPPPTRESILQLNSSVTMIQFRPTRCNLSPINLRALCWAKFSFNFIKPTINPTKLISSLGEPKFNETESR